jgi:hypothetical protein
MYAQFFKQSFDYTIVAFARSSPRINFAVEIFVADIARFLVIQIILNWEFSILISERP